MDTTLGNFSLYESRKTFSFLSPDSSLEHRYPEGSFQGHQFMRVCQMVLLTISTSEVHCSVRPSTGSHQFYSEPRHRGICINQREPRRPRTGRRRPIHRFPYYARTGLKNEERHCCTTSYPSFISPSAILNPAHTQSISAAPFAIPNTSVEA